MANSVQKKLGTSICKNIFFDNKLREINISQNYFETLLNFCGKIFADNVLPKTLRNTILRNKILKTYILHTNKFGKQNGKYCSKKIWNKYLQKYVFRKQIEGN